MNGVELIKPAVTTTIRNFKQSNAATNITAAFKEIAQKFKEIVEIGKFKEIKVAIENPMEQSSIKKAYIILKPGENKNDFRTRILCYLAESPFQDGVTREISYINGNKFAIDSALKDRTRIGEFKSFIKDSEEFFRSMTT